MDAKKLFLLIGALAVAAVTAMMARHMSSSATAPQVIAAIAPPAPTGPQVLVATKPLPIGTILGPDSYKFQPWPKELVDGAYFVKGAAGADPAKMPGMVVRNAITAGQPLTQGSLVSPGDRGFLAAALTPGMRAVTVAVSGATAVAGFVFPGDRVDVVLSEDVAPPTVNATGANGAMAAPVDSTPLRAAETIVRNVRVLATDQRTDNTPSPDGKTDVKNFSLVTLEATPKLAEKIAVAQKLGSLSLSLRPLADDAQQLAAASKDGKVDLSAAAAPQDTGTTFTTGGEVSRFARSSIAAGTSGTGPSVRVARGATVTAMPIAGRTVAAAAATGGMF